MAQDKAFSNGCRFPGDPKGARGEIYNCRCTLTAVVEGVDTSDAQRRALDPETGETVLVPNMTYQEWEARLRSSHGQKAVDKMRKAGHNETADREQYARYKKALRELAPESFVDFQRLKYGSPEAWRAAKTQYRILNSYKVDAGQLSGADILQLDRAVITEKRRNFTSRFKKSGNIAGAYLNGDSTAMYYAHSALDDSPKGYKGTAKLVLLKKTRRFSYIDVLKENGEMRKETWHDTEAKLFEYFADRYEAEPFQSITMLSERGMCDSCKGVMKQFQELHPDVKINVVSNKKVEGDVWKYRGRKK